MKQFSCAAIVAVALLGAGPCGAADLRKCVGADGKTTYIDGPCPAATKPARIAPLSTPSAAVAKFGEWVQFYDVEGIEYATLLASLNKNGPRGFHGEARWWVSYEYRTVVKDQRCVITSAETKMEGKILMPRWTRRQGASADLVARWERYEAALLVHEEGHLDTGRELARVLKAELLKIGSGGDCKALDATVRERFKVLLDAYKQRDVDYDKRTGHGATQGAAFR